MRLRSYCRATFGKCMSRYREKRSKIARFKRDMYDSPLDGGRVEHGVGRCEHGG